MVAKGVEPLPDGYYIWHYNPNIAGSIIFLVLFSVITVAVAWRMLKTRTWFVIALLVGGVFEIVGYGGRAAAHNKTGVLTPYIIQSTLLLIAPALFAATIYMTLGRVVRSINGEHQSIIRPSLVTKIFVTGDVLSFFVQSGGAGMQVKAKTASDTRMGENIILGGLILQIVIFAFFVVVTAVFHSRMSKTPTVAATDGSVPWQRIMFMLYGTGVMIMVRNIFRVIEYGMGQDGYLLSHEWTLYIFDAVLMLGTMVAFFAFFPDQVRPRARGTDDLQLESNTSHRDRRHK